MSNNTGNLSVPMFEAGRIQELGSLDGTRTLEIGCGLGPHARLLSKYTSNYLALDRCKEKIRDARRLYKDPRVTFMSADGGHLPFRNNSFECVIMCHCLHEMECSIQSKTLLEIWRVLMPGGISIIIDTTTEITEFQRCFDIVHENFLFYKHIFPLEHSKWVIRKMVNNRLFDLHTLEIDSLDFVFKNIMEIEKLLLRDFKYEYQFSKQDKLRIKQLLVELLKEKVNENPIYLNERLDVVVLDKKIEYE